MGDAATLDGRFTPILLVVSLFHNAMYAFGFGKESQFGSLSMISWTILDIVP